MLGSEPYIAPEVLQGAAADARADVYALGATLFEALAGERPFQASTAVQALAQRLTQDAPPVGVLRPDVPPWLEALVARCLERDPARRVGSAAALAGALRQAEAPTANFFALAPTTPLPQAPPPPRRPPWTARWTRPPARPAGAAATAPDVGLRRGRPGRTAPGGRGTGPGGAHRAGAGPRRRRRGLTRLDFGGAPAGIDRDGPRRGRRRPRPRRGGGAPAPTPPGPTATPRPVLPTPRPTEPRPAADRVSIAKAARGRAEEAQKELRRRGQELRERAQQRAGKGGASKRRAD